MGSGCRGATRTAAARSVVIGPVVIGAVVLVAGCSSGSSRQGAASTPVAGRSSSTSSASPDVPLPSPVVSANAGEDEMAGSATVSYSTGSAPFTVRTSGSEPAQVAVDNSGHVSIDVTMGDAAGDVFSISGPAAVGGAQTGDHVSIFSPSTGLLVDTQQGNTCTVTYTRAAETGVVGTARCDAQTGAQSFTVTASFHLP